MASGDKEQEQMAAASLEQKDEPEQGTERPSDQAAASSTDARIAAAIDGGDGNGAILLCARHYGPLIGRVAMSMLGSQADAEDVAQDTLIDAHAALASWRREGPMRAWLLAITRRKCARLIEKRARRGAKLRLVHDADRPGGDGETEAQILQRQRARRARTALQGVRPTEREALLLRYAGGLAFREVGAACGIEEAAARKRVSRAIAHLRLTLREEG